MGGKVLKINVEWTGKKNPTGTDRSRRSSERWAVGLATSGLTQKEARKMEGDSQRKRYRIKRVRVTDWGERRGHLPAHPAALPFRGSQEVVQLTLET